MRRRDFITLLGGAAAWPLAAQAQQPKLPVIGYLGLGRPDLNYPPVTAFLEGLAESGYFVGKNVAIEFRWANFQGAVLPQLATDLVGHQVAAIVTHSPPATLAAKAATSTIPIVTSTGADPVKLGLVAGFDRPGGNVTG